MGSEATLAASKSILMNLPPEFARTITGLFGTRGEAWLGELPAKIAAVEARWGLRVGPPYTLTYNYVAPAVQADGTEVVLKLGVPHRELLTEMEALRLFCGRGCARLLRCAPEAGAMLLERLKPGTRLASLADDEAATGIAAEVMSALWQPAPEGHSFPTTGTWMAGFGRLRGRYGGSTGPLPGPAVERAEGLAAELGASAGAPVVLHGDLHHFNILAAEREGWLAIDPKGVVGEPAYEAGALLRNPVPGVFGWPDLKAKTGRRMTVLAERLNLAAARIAGWAYAQMVLSAWWSLEDGGAPHPKWEALLEALEPWLWRSLAAWDSNARLQPGVAVPGGREDFSRPRPGRRGRHR
jgi:streptomycin 6-kinase